MTHYHLPICTCCYAERIPPARASLGYKTCLSCGEIQAKTRKHTIVPMPKSNYIVVTDRNLLKGLNSSHKGGAM
jgi:hypothetical protein